MNDDKGESGDNVSAVTTKHEGSVLPGANDAVLDEVWDRRINAKVAQLYYDAMAARRCLQDRLLKLTTLLGISASGIGSVGLGEHQLHGWAVVFLAVLAALATLLGIVVDYPGERERLRIASDQQADVVEAWDALWLDSQTDDLDYKSVKWQGKGLVQQGNDIASRTGLDTQPQRLMDKLQRRVWRQMEISHE